MVARERKKEMAVLRALGASRAFILRLILAESVTLAVLGALAGIGVAALVLVAFQDFVALNLKIPFIVPSPMAILANAAGALLLSLIISGIASLYPVVMISRSEPYDTILKGN
jgi:putative ABC transport system permease protein